MDAFLMGFLMIYVAFLHSNGIIIKKTQTHCYFTVFLKEWYFLAKPYLYEFGLYRSYRHIQLLAALLCSALAWQR